MDQWSTSNVPSCRVGWRSQRWKLDYCLQQPLQHYVLDKQAVLHVWSSKEMEDNWLTYSPHSVLFLKVNHTMTVPQRTFFMSFIIFVTFPVNLISLYPFENMMTQSELRALKIRFGEIKWCPCALVFNASYFDFLVLLVIKFSEQRVSNDLEKFILLIHFS